MLYSLALPFAIVLSIGPVQLPNYGLTDSQVLALGREKYREFHSTKAGESTAAMMECESIFGQVLYRRNTVLAKKLTTSKQAVLANLRRDLSMFSTSTIEMSASFSGGGTIWNPVHAAVGADVEEVLYLLSGGKAKAAPARKVSDVTTKLAEIRKSIESHRDELDIYKGSGYGYGKAMDAWKGASNAFVSIANQAKLLPRNESDRVLEFCRTEAAFVLSEQP